MTGYKIKYNGIDRLYNAYSWRLTRRAKAAWSSGQVLQGQFLKQLETEIAEKYNRKYAVGIGSATDGLYFAMRAVGLNKDSTVMCPVLSYIATAGAIKRTGADIQYVDTNRFGNIGDLERIKSICGDNNIILIEDCAQANGSSVGGKLSGTFGDFGCFSFHPLKTLAALGDAGGLCVSNQETDHWLKVARNHGHTGRNDTSFWSHNLRLDAIQAAILSDQLPHYRNEILASRNKQAEIYLTEFQRLINREVMSIPNKRSDVFHSYNMFVIMVSERCSFINYMMDNGVEVKVHYPYTIDQLTASRERVKSKNIKNANQYSQRIVSLPIGYHLTTKDIEHIASTVAAYFD